MTDQAGKKRKGVTDALGNMVQVVEDPDSSALVTTYTFDLLGNLRKTLQGDQSRYFMYDALGRLLFAKQPEQDTNSNLTATDPVTGNTAWSVKYLYDANSNITTTTDARNQSISATYDKLNRITLRDYSDSAMPDVSFYYDGIGLGSVPNYSKGKTTKVTSSVSETRNTSFDAMGRLLTSEQRTDGVTYPFEYTYNLSGALIEEKYPSGRVVKNTLNADGELAQVQSRKNANYGFFTYANSFAYDKNGAVTKMQLGNGRWETAEYDADRLQVKQIGLGVTDGDQSLLKLEFKYNSPSTIDNNGSMREQKITVPTVGSNPGFTATQTYTYDSLNRVESATETISSSQTWKQTFTYDRYGNRRFNTSGTNTTTLGSCSEAICNPTFPTDSTNRNRFSSGQGYSYDANGNLTVDAEGKQFFYDQENHQIEVQDDEDTTLGEYFYDGDGKRVKKIAGDEVTVFVYNASGQLVAEYSTQIETENAQVSYLTTDHLGSPRIITDANGTVTSRKDFTAFGENVTSSQRVSGASGNGYDAPNVRQDYTGYEQDGESGLEYAKARYYNPKHGRFTSVDPLTASATIRNPQTFNRYSYVLNSPYKFIDPLGLAPLDNPVRPLINQGGSRSQGVYYLDRAGENETVTINLNIVYDASQMSKESAMEAAKGTLADLHQTFAPLNIQFDVTYVAGSSNESRTGITSGAVPGAINVFLYDNTKGAQQSGTYYNPDSRQIFMVRVAGSKFRTGALAHEVGHLFRHFVNGNPLSGFSLPGKNHAGWCWCIDAANYTEDWAIDATNDRLRHGQIRYGIDFVDDFTKEKETRIKPLINKLGIYGSSPQIVRVPRKATSLDVYRLGAIRVANQQ